MTNKLTCIECPVGCAISVTVENGKVVKVEGNKCPKGEGYAVSETEKPVRILTSTVLTEGLQIKMIPVRTAGPIPKGSLFKAMEEVKNVRLSKPLHVGDVVVENIAGSGIDLVATREAY
jgi:CxxC motif-containing protein